MPATKSTYTKKRIIDRLSSYWKMELGCVVLIPAVMVYFSEAQLSWVSYTAMIPMILLLGIGGIYWRTKYMQLTKPAHDATPLFKTIRKIRPFALLLTLLALVLTAWAWFRPEISAGLNDRITATIASVLALAEYVNYYHRQLQHFDNPADFQRLIKGKGFRRSQMAIDLDNLKI